MLLQEVVRVAFVRIFTTSLHYAKASGLFHDGYRLSTSILSVAGKRQTHDAQARCCQDAEPSHQLRTVLRSAKCSINTTAVSVHLPSKDSDHQLCSVQHCQCPPPCFYRAHACSNCRPGHQLNCASTQCGHAWLESQDHAIPGS